MVIQLKAKKRIRREVNPMINREIKIEDLTILITIKDPTIKLIMVTTTIIITIISKERIIIIRTITKEVITPTAIAITLIINSNLGRMKDIPIHKVLTEKTPTTIITLLALDPVATVAKEIDLKDKKMIIKRTIDNPLQITIKTTTSTITIKAVVTVITQITVVIVEEVKVMINLRGEGQVALVIEIEIAGIIEIVEITEIIGIIEILGIIRITEILEIKQKLIKITITIAAVRIIIVIIIGMITKRIATLDQTNKEVLAVKEDNHLGL